MKHFWPFAALFVFAAAGCVDESGDGTGDLPSGDEAGDSGEGGGGDGGGGVVATEGCDTGATFESELHRLARGGTLEMEIEDAALKSQPRVLRSSAPEILRVAQTGAGAAITGVAPGAAALEVWRCSRKVASYPVTVAEVGSVEVRLSYGAAGRSAPLGALAGIAGGTADQLELTYFDAQHEPLAGRGAADLQFEGGIRPVPTINLGLFDHADGIPREYVAVAIDGAGRFTATASGHEAAVDVTVAQTPDALEVKLVELPLAGAFALEVLGEVAGGLPLAGMAPEFTITPADAFTQLPTEPRTSQLVLIGQPRGPVTFTAKVAGVTKTLTVTFPEM
ncbi:MAG TPA: hypothetical protein VNO30_07860 [Kofleriaceae bacterium]|nr:hypothetical protein [Kofleriaceae bacterium]